VPVKRVQSFEFYGADAQPKPARKGGRAEGTAGTLGRGVSERGIYLGHTIRAHVSPLPPYHRWSNGHNPGLYCQRSEVRISDKSNQKIEMFEIFKL
jgi:hypothetical protein